ncbi:MAG: hypothetical protein PF485_06775 [Bacteroidales bacterium]|jgi:hypothetical protein|nr:hypothetical protein [Bacteroidales bacterium]
MTYYEKVQDLFKMVEEGKILEVLDKYYHKDVIIITDDNKERKGIEVARNHNTKLLKEIDEVLGEGIVTITSDEIRAITMVEFWMIVKFRNGNKKKFEEVAIQYWNDDLIIKENFYSKK